MTADESWQEPYCFKSMKEALKFAIGLTERVAGQLEVKIKGLLETEFMVRTQAIIIDELTIELDEIKAAANAQREEYEC